MFMGMINDKLAAYPRSLEEDKVLLAGDSLTPFSNERHAVIQVAGEKEVLEHYKTHCQVALELLSFDVNDDAAYIARHRELRDSGCRSVSGRARPVSSVARASVRRFALGQNGSSFVCQQSLPHVASIGHPDNPPPLHPTTQLSPWILKYCSLDPMGTIGMCRRMERRRLQQAQEGTSDPARPHIV